MNKILIRRAPQLMVILVTAVFCMLSAAYAQVVDNPDSTTADTSIADTTETDSIPDESEPGDTLDVEDDDQEESEAERNVLLVESEDGDAGKEVRVKIISESQYPVYGASFNVLFDTTRLLVVAAQAGKHVGEGYVLDSVDIGLANASGSLRVSFTADSMAVGPLYHGEDKQLVVVTFMIDSSATGEVPVEFSGLLFSGEGGVELQLEPLPGVVVVDVEDEDEKDESPDTLDIEDDDSLDVEDADSLDVEDADSLDVGDADSLDVEVADSLDVEDADSLDVEEPDSLDDGDGESTLKGDFDGNGKLGVPDLLNLLKAFNGRDAAASLEYDLNDDGRVDVFDLLDLILQLSGKKKGIIKNVVPDSSSNAGKNGKGVWSGVSGAGLASAGTGLAFPDGSVLNVADGFDGSSLAGVTASGGLAGELLGVVESGLSVTAPVVLPRAFSLGQNYPNPFNPSTTIKYEISEDESVFTRLTVHNIRGQVVRTLVNSVKPAGSYQVQWDGLDESGRKVSSGLYFYRIAAGNYTQTRKMVLLK